MPDTVLSEKCINVYKYLVKAMSEGFPPTVREICRECSIKSTSTVHKILDTLEEAGYITRDAYSSRAIRVNKITASANVPVLGKVTAGQPILAVEDIEDYIPYPAKDSDGLFALRVQGLSMINAGILDGDIVIADRNARYTQHDIIIGMDGDEATVKRLEYEDGKVVFMPENENFDPIYPENPSVLGKVIGCYRKY